MPIDLRSDTLTKPTPEMRQVMFEAECDDDVWELDETAKKLQALAAALTGKEAALFVPSGTMGNLTCILSHCERGDEIILGDRSHIFLYERGSTASLASVHPRTVPNLPDGTMDLQQVEKAIRKKDIHYPTTRLICIEQTHNNCGGRVLSLDYIDKVGSIAHSRGLRVHMDGARLFNACVALQVSPARMAQSVDSVTFCLSKGLGCPIGSMVCGTTSFIEKCRQWRKALGGGMRQVGLLAAAGIFALNNNVDRLSEDHSNARLFAQSVAKHCVSLAPVDSNIAIFEVPAGRAGDVVDKAKDLGVLMASIDDSHVRAVLHLHISAEQAEQAGNLVSQAIQSTGAP